MTEKDLRYDQMVEDALRSVVCKALQQVAQHGLPGNHHFYITFSTEHPGVVIPDQLRERYPNEMTIVLQYQFWGLEVGPDAFAVTLSFSNVPERLTVPYQSVVAFADPSVRFGLQFDVSGEDGQVGEDEQVLLGEAAPPNVEAANLKPAARRGQDGGDKVVTLDAFRNIDTLHKK